jgi:ring-1,2-phenylacetyl-CoA epoxidase subunit PaaD
VVTVAAEVLEQARAAVSGVVDPELPMLTLADLGVLRSVEVTDGTVVVTLRPTYTGCPAMTTMTADVRLALAAAGFPHVEVRTDLTPWSSDDITAAGRAALQEHGIAPPGRGVPTGPVDVLLLAEPPAPACPRCGSPATRGLSRHGPSLCTSLHVCRSCAEPFEKVRER